MIEIKPAVIRDASYVMAHMRAADEVEVLCQLPENMRRYEIAYWLVINNDAFVAYWRGKPVMVFGTGPINSVCLSVWAIGTKHAWRAIPEITAFMAHTHVKQRIEQGYLTMEARSHVDHKHAHKWMVQSGAHVSGEPFIFGRGSEEFLLFRWTVTEYHTIKGQHRRPK